MSISETIEQLRSLQRLDEGIRAMETELEALPKRKEAAREDHAAVEKKHQAAQAELQGTQKKRRDLEREISESDQNVIKFENDKLKVKTNEEFRALNHQIELVKEKKSQLEDQILLCYDEEENAAEKAKKLEEELNVVTQQLAEQEKEIDARAEEDRKRLEEFQQQRSVLVEAVEPRLMTRYESIRKRKGGMAVVSVMRGACGGCHTQQPPQKVNEIRKQDAIHNCDFCGCFLLWNVEETAAS